MACVKCAPLAVFLFVAFLMFPAKKVEADCSNNACYIWESYRCPSGCYCYLVVPLQLAGICVKFDSASKMIDAHPNLCQSNDECIKKGSGNFCARYPNSDIEYGWCINSDARKLLKEFLKMPAAIGQ